MNSMNRIGLGCMGMARRNEESSIRTVDTALDHGVTMFNVGEFYNGGESEIVLGNALRQHPRDKYFVSVKFGALPTNSFSQIYTRSRTLACPLVGS